LKIGDVASNYLRLLLDTAIEMGADKTALLQAIGITEEVLTDSTRRFGLTRFMKLGYDATILTGDPSIGLRMGSKEAVMQLSYHGLAAMSSANLNDAFNIVSEFQSLTSKNFRGNFFNKSSDKDRAIISCLSLAPYNDYTYFIVDLTLMSWYNLVRWVTGKEDLVEEVLIEFDRPEHYQIYSDFFNCPVLFGQSSNSIILKSTALTLPAISHSPYMLDTLKDQCEIQKREICRKETLVEKVQKYISSTQLTKSGSKTPTIEEAAEMLGLPTWTLRRKLKDEGSSYQIVVDSMRKNIALRYVQNTALSFGEIAYQLGFSTPGAFQRAFKRWTKTTPGECRRTFKTTG